MCMRSFWQPKSAMAGPISRAASSILSGPLLGQASTREHVRVHWQMLRWAARQRQPQELAAQVLRIVGAAVLTAAGLVPEGNTGGGNVSAFRRLPVPPELAAIIASVRTG